MNVEVRQREKKRNLKVFGGSRVGRFEVKKARRTTNTTSRPGTLRRATDPAPGFEKDSGDI